MSIHSLKYQKSKTLGNKDMIKKFGFKANLSADAMISFFFQKIFNRMQMYLLL